MEMAQSSRLSALAAAQDYGLDADLRWLIALLRRRLAVIAGALAFAVCLTGLYLLISPVQFKATALLLIDPREQKIIKADAVLPGLGPEAEVIESQVSILSSPKTAGIVLSRLGMSESPQSPAIARGPGVVGSANAHEQGKDAVRADGLAAPRASPVDIHRLLRGLEVKRDGLTQIIKVSYSHTDSEQAAKIANAFIAAYLEDQGETRQRATREASEWLQEKLGKLQAQVRASQERVEAYKLKHNIVQIDGKAFGDHEIIEYTKQVMAVRAEVAEGEARLRLMKTTANDPERMLAAAKALQSTVMNEFRQQYALIQRNLGQLVSRYGAQHPEVENAKAELAKLTTEINREVGRIVQSAEQEFEIAKLKLGLLEKNFEGVKKDILKRSELAIGLAELEREAKATSDIYNSVLSRLKETQAQETLGVSNARVVAAALPPLVPDSPKKALMLVLAVAGGLAFGVLIALLLEQLDRSMRTGEQVQAKLGLPAIASLPMIDGEGDRVHKQIELAPASRFTQGIFVLKRAVEAFGGAEPAKTISVISARSGEGKTAITINLARYAATAGLKTLLIDANFRHPGLTALLVQKPGITIADVIDGKTSVEKALVREGKTNLYTLAAGRSDAAQRPMDVLTSEAMMALLVKLRAQFDLIVIDTAPLLENVDCWALVQVTDGSILVIEAGQTSPDDVKLALAQAHVPQDRLIGCILNKAMPQDGVADLVHAFNWTCGQAKRAFAFIRSKTARRAEVA